ncbi:delta-60 repeat domain-containing protein [Pseudomonas fontis]|uniref:Delta-60 repeat domain-containing protein n=1 Tax=Pseudomonas fontis TaxID=2942633 RepID=A0ABT5NP99_9PSED|nr:delta-60 repeat domain-containing protein [Pseudomonas fontis]MDD0974469.1 delta-60 repeat domain-containing protein [Pseudomonas fontis]MDD0990011.1 delta-60 repeat domain-containing protein [Pseudomonas fontis]
MSNELLDEEYGPEDDNGIVRPQGLTTVAASVAVGAQRICVGDAGNSYALFRIDDNGIVDTTFGMAAGLTKGQFKAGSTANGRSVRVLSDGKILVTGIHHEKSKQYPALARFDHNGLLDTSFGTAGHVVLLHLPEKAGDLHVEAFEEALPQAFSDRAAAATVVAVSSDSTIYLLFSFDQSLQAVIKLNVDGMPDERFGKNGYKVLSHAKDTTTSLSGLSVQGEHLYLCGFVFSITDDEYIWTPCLIRLDRQTGNEDHGFGKQGYAFLESCQGNFRALDVDIANDRIFCVGNDGDWEEFNTLTAVFNTKGVDQDVTEYVRFGDDINSDWSSINRLATGERVVVGSYYYVDTFIQGIAVGRFKSDGTLDENFADGQGLGVISLGNENMTQPLASYSDADGNTLVHGMDIDGPRTGFLLRCLTAP